MALAGPITPKLWIKKTITIDPSSTIIVDIIPIADFSRIKYFITYLGLLTGSSKGLDLVVQNDNGNVTNSVSSRLGGNLNISTNVSTDGVDMSLEVINGETEGLNLTFIKNIL
jgi:hypothetical protein